MKSLRSYLLTLLACGTGTLLTYGALHVLGAQKNELMFVMGAIAGSQVAAWRMVVDLGTTQIPMFAKLQAGVALGITNASLGLALTLTLHPFVYPDITIGISALGSVFFPLALTNPIARAIHKAKAARKGHP